MLDISPDDPEVKRFGQEMDEVRKIAERGIEGIPQLTQHLSRYRNSMTSAMAHVELVGFGIAAIQPLLSILKASDKSKQEIIEVLGGIGRGHGPEAEAMVIPILIDCLGYGTQIEQHTATTELIKFGPNCITRLIEAENNPHPDIRRYSREALARISVEMDETLAESMLGTKRIPLLIEALHTKEAYGRRTSDFGSAIEDVKSQVINRLAKLHPASTDALLDALAGAEGEGRKNIEQALKKILPSASLEQQVRYAVFSRDKDALRTFGTDPISAANITIEFLLHPDKLVREHAIRLFDAVVSSVDNVQPLQELGGKVIQIQLELSLHSGVGANYRDGPHVETDLEAARKIIEKRGHELAALAQTRAMIEMQANEAVASKRGWWRFWSRKPPAPARSLPAPITKKPGEGGARRFV